MAFILKLTDGTDTIDFIDPAFQVEDGGLQVSPPEEVQTWTDPSAEGGARLVDSRQGNRTISITFHIAGTTRLEIRQGINRINTLLRTAINHSLGRESKRVTLQYAWDGVGVVDNFEVFSGKLTLPDDVLSVEKIHARWGDSFRLRGCQLELAVSPNSYGLSPSTGELIELPLSNRNGTNVTGGLLVKPFTDARNVTDYGWYIDNYAEIKGSDILGDSPAKLRIEIQSNSNVIKVDRVVIGAHVKNSGQLFFHWTDPNMEMLLSGAAQNVSYTLGGSIWRSNTINKTWTGKLWRIKLPTPEIYGSKKYRVFMATGFWPWTYPTRVPMRLTVESEKSVTLAQGPIMEQYFSSSGNAMIQDLGVVQIPPFSPKMPTPQDVYLTMNVLSGATYDYAMSVGYVWLVPVESGYRFLKFQQSLDNYVALYPKIVEDYWEGISYVTNDFGEKSIAAVHAMYAPITLTPGKDHRLYFNFMGHNYIPWNGDIWNVRVFYSPSYLGAV